MKLIYTLYFTLCLSMFSTVENYAQSSVQNDSSLSANLDIFTAVYRKIIGAYPDSVDLRSLMLAGMNPMLESLDPYTNFFTEDDVREFKIAMAGKFGGTGMFLGHSKEGVIIDFTFAGYPADKAGLRAADLIIEVNGNSTKEKSLDEVMDLLRGAPGTIVSIIVQRPGETQNISRNLKRETISVSPVTYYGMLNDDIAYLHLARESEDCAKEVEVALKELHDNYNFKGLVFDLRGNEGGFLSQAVKIANLFVGKGNLLVSTRGKEEGTNYYAVDTAAFPAIPIAVLVNSMTVSSGEILAGALQDNDRAVLIGQKTFGKGLVQKVFDMPYGTQLKLTTEYFYTPSGRSIQAFGYTAGKPTQLADSTKKVYKTKNGRDVYSNGGISPDITTAYQTSSPVLQTLLKDRLIFDFSTKFKIAHSSIGSSKNFTITDDDYVQFIEFAESHNFKYMSETENMIHAVKKEAEKEGYWEDIKNEYFQLENNLVRSIENELLNNKQEIKNALEAEIISRYYYQRGRYEALLRNDAEVEKALEILKDTGTYMKLLH